MQHKNIAIIKEKIQELKIKKLEAQELSEQEGLAPELKAQMIDMQNELDKTIQLLRERFLQGDVQELQELLLNKNDEEISELCRRIVEIRKSRGMNLREFAEALGNVSVAAISQLERCAIQHPIHFILIQKIMDTFNLSLADLIS
ncbi:MAG: helix-turn-helix domain-containing protein [Candidatus Margulisbacteria bacterium]|jgi:DNA-binding transcriptional regulator YiaG|nr:helix-turn-helix domain-containing protein [Candidatus Margulisiibacteriota bacterium]